MIELIVGLVAIAAIGGAAWLWSRRPNGRARRPPYLTALSALVDDDRETAFRELKNAVREDSTNADAYLRLGDLFRERGDLDRALQIHRELTTRRGLDEDLRARVAMSLARDHLVAGRLQKAAEAAEEAVKRAPEPIAALELLQEVHERRGDPDGAFRAVREKFRREGREKTGATELAEYRAEQARTLLDAGRPDDAERLLKDARKHDGTAPKVMYVTGLVREKQGDYTGAIRAWEEILERHPKKIVYLFRSLERVHFLNGTYGDMESTYTSFLEKVPGHEDASFGLARFLRRKGQTDTAIDVCRSALDQHPESESLRVLFLTLLVHSGRAGEAENRLNDWISGILGEETPRSSTAEDLLESSS
ncbi:MAG: tetratricopeptide repeat protein [bacterium]|nr:tetratricopeptide repeat protein [Gemmatimonadota bacterium]